MQISSQLFGRDWSKNLVLNWLENQIRRMMNFLKHIIIEMECECAGELSTDKLSKVIEKIPIAFYHKLT